MAIVIFLSVMATNTMGVYGMVNSVVGAQRRTKLKFLPVALVLGIVSILGSTWLALLDQYTDFLTMIGAFFVPVFAIPHRRLLHHQESDLYEGYLEDAGGISHLYTSRQLSRRLWVIGALVSYLFTYAFLSPIGATIPSFLASFLLYLGLSWRSRHRFAEVAGGHLSEFRK